MTRLQTKWAVPLACGGLAIGGLAVAAGSGEDKLDQLLEGITLTDAQQAIVDDLRQQDQANEEALAAAHEELVDVFLTELERDQPRRGKLYVEMDGFVDLIGDSARDHLDGVLDLYAAFDAEQKVMFRQNIEDMQDQSDMFDPGSGPE